MIRLPRTLLAALLVTGGVAYAQAQVAVDAPAVSGEPQGIDVTSDEETLADAVQVLYEAGYKEDAQRVKSILAEMIERRMAFDIDDRGARVEALERIQRTFEGLGWESNAASLEYIVALGRAVEEGRGSVDIPRPPSLDLAPGQTLSTELLRIVEQAAEVFPQNGAAQAGRDAQRLSEFYRARAEREARSGDLTYIEGRAPVLALVAEAYRSAGEETDPNTLAWVEWLRARSADRLEDPDAKMSPYPDSPFPQGLLTDVILGASDLWLRAGEPGNAARCRDLADYYAKRARGDAPDNSAARPGAVAAPVVTEDGTWRLELGRGDEGGDQAAAGAERAQLESRVQQLAQEAAALRAEVEALQGQLRNRR